MLTVTALGMLLAGGCHQRKAWEEREVDHGLVHIDTEHLHLRHDQVGHDRWESRTTFALVDAHNTHTEDLVVTLGGELVAEDGRAVGRVRPASLRIPADGVRTFALIDKDQAVHEQATSVRVQVLGAYVPNFAPTVQITDGNVYQDGDRVVVRGLVRNAVDRPVRALIFAGFYDARGVPLTRPFTEMHMGGDTDHPAMFVGPPGSVKGYLFVGDTIY